jgi:hypothetical protein
MKITDRDLAAFIRDPVMAAAVLLGWELDAFQAAALRFDWWFPVTVDDSAVSTGKTLRTNLLTTLRATLIPNQEILVYYPVWQIGKDEYWPYFAKTIERSDFFLDQLKPHRGGVAEHLDSGCWRLEFKNGSRILMPAPGFEKDAQSQASRRCNTLVVDDWRRVVDMGEGVDKQLIDRATAPSFNASHPVWCNHVHLKGHAEKPSHPSQRRVKGYRRLIRDGSMRPHIYSFCHKDISAKWAPLIRPDETIREQKATLPRDQFIRQWLGITQRDGRTYYPEAVLLGVCRIEIVPELKRVLEEDHYALGVDIARGQTAKADSSAGVAWRLRLKKTLLGHRGIVTESKVESLVPVFSWEMRNKTAGQTAAKIHEYDLLFMFGVVVMDPGGGGLWVLPELRNATQLIRNVPRKVIPITTSDDVLTADRRPIVHMWRRSGRFSELEFVEPSYLGDDAGFIQCFHQRYRQEFEGKELLWPARLQTEVRPR